MSDTGRIISAIADLLAGIDGTGSFENDLSGEDQVLHYAPPATGPDRSPSVYIFGAQLDSSPEGKSLVLGHFERSLTINFEAYANVDTSTANTPLEAAYSLLEDIQLVLESTRVPGQKMLGLDQAGDPVIRDFTISQGALDGNQLSNELFGWGVVAGVVVVNWHRRRGGQSGL